MVEAIRYQKGEEINESLILALAGMIKRHLVQSAYLKFVRLVDTAGIGLKKHKEIANLAGITPLSIDDHPCLDDAGSITIGTNQIYFSGQSTGLYYLNQNRGKEVSWKI